MRDLARQDLSRYYQARLNVLEAEDRLEHLRAKATRYSIPISEDKVDVMRTPNPKGIEELYALIADQAKLITDSKLLAEKICLDVEARISNCKTDLHKRLLRAYWLDEKSLEYIAVKEDYSYYRIKHLHLEALDEYGEVNREFLKVNTP